MPGSPIHQLIGTAAERRTVYVSSMFLVTPEECAVQALEVQTRGFQGDEVHPPGPAALNLEVYAAVRCAVGSQLSLMTVPVATHIYEEALRVGRFLESLGYLWFEEPVYDYGDTIAHQAGHSGRRNRGHRGGEGYLTAQFIANGAGDV